MRWFFLVFFIPLNQFWGIYWDKTLAEHTTARRSCQGELRTTRRWKAAEGEKFLIEKNMQSQWEVNKRLWPHDGILPPGRARLHCSLQRPVDLFLPSSIQPRTQVCCQPSTRSLPNRAAPSQAAHRWFLGWSCSPNGFPSLAAWETSPG